jgi:hypothetical protein
MKTRILLKIIAIILISLSSMAQERDKFYRIVSIDEPFHFSTHTTVADASKRESYEKFLEKLTTIWANVLISYQQEYDYEFVANYKNKKKVQTDEVLEGLVMDTKELNDNHKSLYMLNVSPKEEVILIPINSLNGHIAKVRKADELFLAIKETRGNIVQSNLSNWLIIPLDSLMLLNQLDLLKRVQLIQKQVYISEREVISYKLTPENKLGIKNSISIDSLIVNESETDEKYSRQLTDLLANSFINRQIDSVTHEKFNFYRNYEYKDNKQKSESVIKGVLSYKKEYDTYTLRVWIENRNTGERIVPSLREVERITFNAKDRYSYSEVTHKIYVMTWNLLLIYFQEINQQEGDIQLNDKK